MEIPCIECDEVQMFPKEGGSYVLACKTGMNHCKKYQEYLAVGQAKLSQFGAQPGETEAHGRSVK